ncbi:unnamed protein product, partial [Prunus brigantina]
MLQLRSLSRRRERLYDGVGKGVPGVTSVAQQPEASTSGRGEAAAGPSSRPRVSVVFPSNPRVPMGVPTEHMFGVDYLPPNKITELDIAKYRRVYFIPDSASVAACRPEDPSDDRLCPWPVQPQFLGSADGSGHGLR